MSSQVDKPSKNLTSNIGWNNFIAGVAGGAISTAVFHPLELIKIRWQVYEAVSLKGLKIIANVNTLNNVNVPVYRPKYKSLLDTVKNIYNKEHGIKGLYRGLMINMIASSAAWGSYFLIYNTLKSRHQKQNNLTFINYTLDATLSGIATILVTNPLFLIKTRMCLQYNEQLSTKIKYKNSWHALKVLLKTDGPLGLYKGIIPGLFGTLNGTIQMVSYDLMKSWWSAYLKQRNTEQKLDSFHYSLFSSLSKILAVTITFPFQVVRTRIQDQHQSYKNLTEVIIKTYRNEKIYGFYKGIFPCLLRVTPAAALTFIVYENLLQFLSSS